MHAKGISNVGGAIKRGLMLVTSRLLDLFALSTLWGLAVDIYLNSRELNSCGIGIYLDSKCLLSTWNSILANLAKP